MAYRLLLSLTLLGLCSGYTGCPGCPWPLDPKSPQVLELADKVIAKVQADNNVPNCLFREEVYNATRQTVAGDLYRLIFRAGHSACKPPNCAQKIKERRCNVGTPIPDLNIKASIWQKSWEHFEKITFEILH